MSALPASEPVYVAARQQLTRNAQYLLGIEHIRNVWEEASFLHKEHWKETEEAYLNHPDDEFRPDYERAARCQDNGVYALFTGRTADTLQLVANISFFVMPSFHDRKRVTANEDMFFVLPAHRGRLAVELVDYAESCLKGFGVHCIGMTDKHPCGGPDLSKFLGRRGYKPVARYFLKSMR